MTAKKVMLTLPESMFKRLEREKDSFSYESVQEVIKEVLRDRFFRNQTSSGGKRGRPKKTNLYKVGSAKKVFK
tara:strand:+ start:141 stop:359 length:219 start_codon:yes stop_codon:yes gene_type:complete